MTIRRVQTCDGCGTERDLPANSPEDVGGWRTLAVRGKFGPAEQPTLCPECLDKTETFVDGLATASSAVFVTEGQHALLLDADEIIRSYELDGRVVWLVAPESYNWHQHRATFEAGPEVLRLAVSKGEIR